ncbi:MAG: hypothetical protein WD401_06890 [Thermomicrobiaceae bacterium]
MLLSVAYSLSCSILRRVAETFDRLVAGDHDLAMPVSDKVDTESLH